MPNKVLIRQFPDTPQRMTGRDPLLDRHVGKQGAAALPVTSHLGLAADLFSRRTGFSANSWGVGVAAATPSTLLIRLMTLWFASALGVGCLLWLARVHEARRRETQNRPVSLAIYSRALTKALEITKSMTMAAPQLSGGPHAEQDSIP